VNNPRALVISEETAESLGASVGDLVLMQLETISGQQNAGDFAIAAVAFEPGLLSAVSAYADADTVNALANLEQGEYMKLGGLLKDVRSMERFAARLTAVFQQDGLQLFPKLAPSLGLDLFDVSRHEGQWSGVKYQISTLGDYLSQLSRIISVLNLLGWGILAVLLFIIMAGITNTYRIIMYEGTREMGTMRALGMQRPAVRVLLLLEAFFLEFPAALAGTLTGLIIMGCVSLIQWGLDTPLFLLRDGGRMRFSVFPWQVTVNTAFVLLMCTAGAVVSASRAAALQPASALRKTY